MAGAKKEELKKPEVKKQESVEVEYVAKADGFLNKKGYIVKGQKFKYAGKPGKWMKKVESKK